jgi:ATP-dependent exoDNAse (exonuclease V) beta subunit
LFHDRLAEDACELALTDYSSGLRLDYSIDRTFVDGTGTRWIIDYKSAQPRAGQALEEFLQEQTERYRPQLANYARLLQALDARQSRCALYFTALPHLHLVSTAA